MGTDGSERGTGLGAVAAVAVLLLGLAAMQGAAILTVRFGMRPMLLVSESALVLPALLSLLLLRLPIAASLGLAPAGLRLSLLSLGLGVALWVASVGLLGLQSAAWPPDPAYLDIFRRLLEALRPTGPLDALVSVAAIAVVPAVCEETLVRGVVLPPLARALGGPAGVLVSALLFGAIHMDAYRFPFTFAVGVALGALRLRTGSLTPGILAHATLNTITFAASPFLDDPSANDTPAPVLAGVLLALGTMLSVRALRSLGPKQG